MEDASPEECLYHSIHRRLYFLPIIPLKRGEGFAGAVLKLVITRSWNGVEQFVTFELSDMGAYHRFGDIDPTETTCVVKEGTLFFLIAGDRPYEEPAFRVDDFSLGERRFNSSKEPLTFEVVKVC